MTRPYESPDALVADRIAASALRVAIAASPVAERGPLVTRLEDLEDTIDARIRAAIRAGEPPAATWLRTRLGLTRTEEHLVWLLIACELSPPVRTQIRALATEASADPTIDVIRRVVYGEAPSAIAWRELGSSGALQRLQLIERTDEARGDVPPARQTLRVASRIVSLVLGDDELDAEVRAFARPGRDDLVLADLAIDAAARAALATALARAPAPAVLAVGPRGAGRRSVLTAAASSIGYRTLEIDAAGLLVDADLLARRLRVLVRELLLLERVPLIRELDRLHGEGDHDVRLGVIDRELVAGWTGPVFATSSVPLTLRWSRPVVSVALGPITDAERAAVWRRAVPEAPDEAIATLVARLRLAPGCIHAAAAVARASTQQPIGYAAIAMGARSVVDDRLAGLAERVTVTQSWDDLVLPDDQLAPIKELIARTRHRGTVLERWGFGAKLGRGHGISALFSGPPGTGKTMAAGLVARELGLELYRVDLSRIVSKWIGETEKNLAAVFDAGEAGACVLLFDEADALFGKRTQVATANDRYANLEVNYLLQRIEAFTGICVLTSNHESAIDEAFRRRLTLHVRFPVPEEAERARIWRAMIPAAAEIAPELGLDALARSFEMSGGYIRNAAVRAAFLAADEGAPISAHHLAYATQLEYEAMGKLRPRSSLAYAERE